MCQDIGFGHEYTLVVCPETVLQCRVSDIWSSISLKNNMVQSKSVCKQTDVPRVQEIIRVLCYGSGPFYFGHMFCNANSTPFIFMAC